MKGSIIIPEKIKIIKQLNLYDKVILSIIVYLTRNDKNVCYASSMSISQYATITPKTVNNSINKLCKLGLIEKTVIQNKHKLIRIKNEELIDLDYFKKETNNIPKWVYENIEKDIATNEEIAEIDKMIKECV